MRHKKPLPPVRVELGGRAPRRRDIRGELVVDEAEQRAHQAVARVLRDAAGARPAHGHDELEQRPDVVAASASALVRRRRREPHLPRAVQRVGELVEEVLKVEQDH
eukprot:164659-Pleurochrysis_carterae.AAC.4